MCTFQKLAVTIIFAGFLGLSQVAVCDEAISVYNDREVHDEHAHKAVLLEKYSEELAELQELYRENEEFSHSIIAGEIHHRTNMAIIDAMQPNDSYYRYEYDYGYQR